MEKCRTCNAKYYLTMHRMYLFDWFVFAALCIVFSRAHWDSIDTRLTQPKKKTRRLCLRQSKHRGIVPSSVTHHQDAIAGQAFDWYIVNLVFYAIIWFHFVKCYLYPGFVGVHTNSYNHQLIFCLVLCERPYHRFWWIPFWCFFPFLDFPGINYFPTKLKIVLLFISVKSTDSNPSAITVSLSP